MYVVIYNGAFVLIYLYLLALSHGLFRIGENIQV